MEYTEEIVCPNCRREKTPVDIELKSCFFEALGWCENCGWTLIQKGYFEDEERRKPVIEVHKQFSRN